MRFTSCFVAAFLCTGMISTHAMRGQIEEQDSLDDLEGLVFGNGSQFAQAWENGQFHWHVPHFHVPIPPIPPCLLDPIKAVQDAMNDVVDELEKAQKNLFSSLQDEFNDISNKARSVAKKVSLDIGPRVQNAKAAIEATADTIFNVAEQIRTQLSKDSILNIFRSSRFSCKAFTKVRLPTGVDLGQYPGNTTTLLYTEYDLCSDYEVPRSFTAIPSSVITSAENVVRSIMGALGVEEYARSCSRDFALLVEFQIEMAPEFDGPISSGIKAGLGFAVGCDGSDVRVAMFIKSLAFTKGGSSEGGGPFGQSLTYMEKWSELPGLTYSLALSGQTNNGGGARSYPLKPFEVQQPPTGQYIQRCTNDVTKCVCNGIKCATEKRRCFVNVLTDISLTTTNPASLDLDGVTLLPPGKSLEGSIEAAYTFKLFDRRLFTPAPTRTPTPAPTSNPTVTLKPGSIITIYNPSWKNFVRMPTGKSFLDTSPFPSSSLENFRVVDAGNGQYAFWNPLNKCFIRMNPNQPQLDRSAPSQDGALPAGWLWERFKVVDVGNGEVAFWNQVSKAFIRSQASIVDKSALSPDATLDSGWRWERYKINQDSLTPRIYWSFAVANGNVYSITQTDAGGSFMIETRVLDASQNFQKFKKISVQSTTALETPRLMSFAVHPSTGNLFILKQRITGTNSTEVHILGAPKYQSFTGQYGTALHEINDFGTWLFFVDSKNDLYCIKRSITGSSKTEIHALSATSQYQKKIINFTTTAFGDTSDPKVWAFAFDSESRDLYGIKRSYTGSKSTEIHRLSAASSYTAFTLQTGTALHETGGDQIWSFAIYKQDLWCIRQAGTGTNTTEIHVLAARYGYKRFTIQSGTALPETPPNLSCRRPPGWCSHPNATFSYVDCDQDGFIDPVCTDLNGGFWVLQSTENCQERVGTSGNTGCKSACTRTQGWCNHPGSTFSLADCDGDNTADPVCTDTKGNFWTLESTKGCATRFGGACRSCSRPPNWCFHSGQDFILEDCDGDGQDDPICSDLNGVLWARQSTKGCTTLHTTGGFPGGCSRPKGWCNHAGSTFTFRDVDRDGKLDPVCTDTAGLFVTRLSSKNCNDQYIPVIPSRLRKAHMETNVSSVRN